MRRVQQFVETRRKEDNRRQVIVTTVETVRPHGIYVWQSVQVNAEKQRTECGFKVTDIERMHISVDDFLDLVGLGITPKEPAEFSPDGRLLFSSNDSWFNGECSGDSMEHATIRAAISAPYTCRSVVTVECSSRNVVCSGSSCDRFLFTPSLLARIYDFARRDDVVNDFDRDDASNVAAESVLGVNKDAIDEIGEKMRSSRSFQLQGHNYLIDLEPRVEKYDLERDGPSLVREWVCTLGLVQTDIE